MRHEDTTPFRCYDEFLYETSIQSTTREREKCAVLSPSSEFILVCVCVCVSAYLVATHVVTLVHDHRFFALVVLPDIQTGFRALVLNLRHIQVNNPWSIWSHYLKTRVALMASTYGQ